ncbi:MAG: hypothetical protein EOO77_19910, partial [Oxalobacteraceae bacterium]
MTALSLGLGNGSTQVMSEFGEQGRLRARRRLQEAPTVAVDQSPGRDDEAIQSEPGQGIVTDPDGGARLQLQLED